ncbi:MAG TPA: RNA polymerase sigma factor [Planctomycetota bacterium]|nr:RNA polymerase sigma factor [Planctomycetota bacterium]
MAMVQSDEELLAEFCGGRRDAFEPLYHRHASNVLTYLCTMLKDRDIAEDILQQVFISLAQNAHALNPGTNLRAYLFAGARNRALNVRRDRQNRPRFVSVETFPTTSEMSPGANIENAETLRKLNAAIDALPEGEREVVLLHTRADLGFREIAEMTGTPQGTVATRYRTALGRMKEFLSHD